MLVEWLSLVAMFCLVLGWSILVMIGFEECEEFGEGFRVLGTIIEGFGPVRVLLSFWFEGFYLMDLAGIVIALVIPLVIG